MFDWLNFWENISDEIKKYSLELGGVFISTNELHINNFIGTSTTKGNLKFPSICI